MFNEFENDRIVASPGKNSLSSRGFFVIGSLKILSKPFIHCVISVIPMERVIRSVEKLVFISPSSLPPPLSFSRYRQGQMRKKNLLPEICRALIRLSGSKSPASSSPVISPPFGDRSTEILTQRERYVLSFSDFTQ